MQLVLNQVQKRYGNTLGVDTVNLQLTPGVYGLLGVNGAGKSTLMRMMCTILAPTSGTITLDGQDIFAMGAEYRRLLGYLPQDFGFYPDLRVWDYLMYIAAIKGLRPMVAKTRATQFIEQVGLADQSGTKMRHLSGGMRRRVGIAQALLNEPSILILDEPTAGLDPNERVRFRSLIAALSTERLIMVSTHVVSDIEYVAHKLLLMNHGVLIAQGRASDLIASIGSCVWQVSVTPKELSHYQQRFVVAHVRQQGELAELRIIAPEQPTPSATPVPATLEDVCLVYFKE